MTSRSSRFLACALVVLAAGCHKSTDSNDGGPAVDAGPPDAGVLHTTYRVIGGVSMGALGASMVGLKHPDKFDAVVALGGPMDAAFLGTHMIEQRLMAGFCTREQLEAALATNPQSLNDPKVMTCTQDVAPTVSTEHAESFNHWRFTHSGGHFTRSSYLDLFYDLTSALGNFGTYNPDSAIAPTGVPESWVKNPPADACTNPIRIKGKLSDPNGTPIYNAEYNPEGKYDAITFCDGEESPIYYCTHSKIAVDFCGDGGGAIVPQAQEATYAAAFCAGDTVSQATDDQGTPQDILDIYNAAQGRYDPCRQHFEPIRVALAFDYNGNGMRDYAEPVVNNSHERYDDVGTDGCPDNLEDGDGGCVTDPSQSPFAHGVADPNHDNYDYANNALGTEGDWRYEPGEPFQDNGLDGVPNTHDFGEGNGTYDESRGLAKLHAYDPRHNYLALTTQQQHQMDLYLEGGIRDVFNFGVAAEVFAGAVKATDPMRIAEFSDFPTIPASNNPPDETNSHGDDALWNTLPPNTLEIYGFADAGPDDLEAGDGDHVGTDLQALLRFAFMESWVANRWQALPLPPKPPSSGDFNQRVTYTTYHSNALNADRDFSIYLPPGYYDPSEANTHYPVLYLLHGYGQDATDLAATAIALFEPPMGALPRGSPITNGRPYIVVFPSGRCCFQNDSTQAIDCTLAHQNDTGWSSMCNQGSFYINASGPTADAPAYEDGLLDLVDYVDAHYRTLAPADVPQR
ncbi:MAG: hypothetical protein JST54_04840 [Deltaproteobacteria bacterium]|nr:hypothetical protein [Deltaproteobacteria bacterium]